VKRKATRQPFTRAAWRNIGRQTVSVARRALPFLAPLVVALALRFLVIPPRLKLDVAQLIGDEGNYVGIAETVAVGAGIPDRWAWLRPPGYPLILAGLIRLFGRDLHAPMVLQALASTALVGITALLAGQLWGRRAAIVAAWATALNPSLIFYTRILHTETLYTLCATAAILTFVAYARPGATVRPLAVAAVCAALAALLRPAIVAPLPLIVAWLILRRPRVEWRIAARHVVLFGAIMAALIAPNAMHNWLAYRHFIPLDTTLGYIFWLDHRDGSRQELIDTLSEIRNPGDRQQYALRQGLAWVAAHPRETIAGSIANLRIFWGEPPYADDAIERRPGIPDGWRATANMLTALTWLLIAPLAVVALGRARRFDPLVPLLVIGVAGPTIGVALSHHENRYLIPTIPPLIALASGIVAPAAALVWSRRRAALTTATLALLLLNAVLISGGLVRERGLLAGRWLLAAAATRFGDTALAGEQYDAIARANPRLSAADEGRARLAYQGGDRPAALVAARRALERDPENFRARALAAMLLRDDGQLDEARRVARYASVAPEVLSWGWDNPTAPPPVSLALDGTDIGHAQGFYGAEQGEGGRFFRWMAERGQMRLAAPAGPSTLVLVLASPRPPEEEPVAVEVTVNGQALDVVTVRRERGWNEIRLALPDDRDQAAPLVIELRADTITRPDDRRRFGVAVAAATIEAGR
jgi:4-amino-4-deoxy-L-arabinose transferase-like glycosyltransferase